MKKSVILSTTAAGLGLATVLTFAAAAPSFAKTANHSTTTKSAGSSSSGNQGGISFGTTADARKTTTVNFTITNVPTSITSAADAAKLVVVKIAPLAADATA
ncbi:MAG: hypothetical protein RJA35_396, partial [Actinomycetota bacterium]